MMELLVKKYTPNTLPYHIIVPSLPDYGLSSGPTQNVEVTLEQAARAMNQLMIDLGFGHGYVAQGGDVGFMLARLMSTRFTECKAFHRKQHKAIQIISNPLKLSSQYSEFKSRRRGRHD